MPRVDDQAGLVYYALDATTDGSRVKIGFTTNLRQRMSALRGFTGSRQTPIVLAVEPGSIALEAQRHAQFVDLLIGHEWFTYAEPLTSFIRGLEHPYDLLQAHHDLQVFSGGWLSIYPVMISDDGLVLDFDEHGFLQVRVASTGGQGRS